jgi:hypothetical protein
MSAIRPRRLVVLAFALAGVIAGCSGNGSPTPPAATSRPTSSAPVTSSTGPATTTTLGLRQQILAAYDNSWRVYSDALRRLDPRNLATAFAGDALRQAEQDVATQKAKHQPVRIRITHHPRVLLANATDGVVRDNYENHSVVLDAASGRPIEPDPNEIVRQRQSLKRVDGVWKVVEVIEEQ